MRKSGLVALLASCVVGALAGCGSPPDPLPPPPAPAAIAEPAPKATLPPTASAGRPTFGKTWPSCGGGFVSGVVFSPVLCGTRLRAHGRRRRLPDESRQELDAAHRSLRASRFESHGHREHRAGSRRTRTRCTPPSARTRRTGPGKGAILRSNNQGADWQRTDMPIKMGGNENGRSNGERLAVDPNEPKILYFGSRKDGLWKSVDGAVTLRRRSRAFRVKEDKTGLGIPFVVFDAKSGKGGTPTPKLYAGVSNAEANLYESDDAGATWAPVKKSPSGHDAEPRGASTPRASCTSRTATSPDRAT